jgi:hypothetical protein
VPAISNQIFSNAGGTASISVTNTSTIAPPITVNCQGANYYLVSIDCVQTGAASNALLKMQIGFQSTLVTVQPSIAIDGASPTSSTTPQRIWATVGLGSTFFTCPSFTTILQADDTRAFALSAYVSLTSAPGSSVPTFAFWTMTVTALN